MEFELNPILPENLIKGLSKVRSKFCSSLVNIFRLLCRYENKVFQIEMEKKSAKNEKKKSFNADIIGTKDFDINQFNRVVFLGCGTAYYAGKVGVYDFEKYLNIPCTVELASEFRYRSPVVDEKTLIIALLVTKKMNQD